MDLINEIFQISKKVKSHEELFELMGKIFDRASASLDIDISAKEHRKYVEFLILLEQSQLIPSATYEQDEIFRNTLSLFDVDMGNPILINALKQLIKYDKVIVCEGIEYYGKLLILLVFCEKGINTLGIFQKESRKYSLVARGIAHYGNGNNDAFITPLLNSVNTAMDLNHDSTSLAVTKNVLTTFQQNSIEADYAMQIVHTSFGKDGYKALKVPIEEYLAYYNIRQTLNASSWLKEKEIYDSIEIMAISLYGRVSLINNIMRLTNRVNIANIARSLNNIMEHFVGIPNSNILTKHFKKVVQHKSYYHGFEIFEYRNKRNFKPHPVFENKNEEEYLKSLFQ